MTSASTYYLIFFLISSLLIFLIFDFSQIYFIVDQITINLFLIWWLFVYCNLYLWFLMVVVLLLLLLKTGWSIMLIARLHLHKTRVYLIFFVFICLSVYIAKELCRSNLKRHFLWSPLYSGHIWFLLFFVFIVFRCCNNFIKTFIFQILLSFFFSPQ